MRTRAAPMRSARAIRKGLRDFMIYRPVNQAMRKVGHCFARNATEKVKENYLSYGKGDEGEGEGEGRGCRGEA